MMTRANPTYRNQTFLLTLSKLASQAANTITNLTAEKHDARSPSHSQESLDSSNQQVDDDQVVIDNQSTFAAERILRKRKRKGKIQHKVKLLGYPEDQSTWEPEENIWDKSLIEHFEHAQRRNQRNPVYSMFESQFSICFIASLLCHSAK